jgi:outer membrane protein OmpA-like peptidoglycan-associated protein
MSAGSVIGRVSLHRASVYPLLALSVVLVAAGALAQMKDVPGSKDHPMIKRFEGSVIIGYEFKKFNDLVILLGPVKGEYSPFLKGEYEMERDKSPLAPTKSQTVEGQSTRILYVAPPERSPLEVLRNYERELQKNGFEPLFKCSREQCSQQDGALGWLYLYPPKRRLLNTPGKPGSARWEGVSFRALSYATDQHFLTAKRTSPGGDTYVSVYSARGGFNDHKQTFEHPVLLLEVIEAIPMENKMVTVDAAAMAKEVAATGHVALYGILFDTNKTDIKPESVAALDEIAKFLKTDPKVVVYIVGHTDNVGGYEHNMALSQRRADAVVKELTNKYGIAAARMKSAGTGPLVPVAPNDTEEGRAKNRRVELVKQ